MEPIEAQSIPFRPWDGEIVLDRKTLPFVLAKKKGEGSKTPEGTGAYADIVELNEDNIASFEGFVPADIADHIGRVFFFGLVAMVHDVPSCGMVWELLNMREHKEKESRILWLKTLDEEAADEMLKRYEGLLYEDGVKTSSYSIPAEPVCPEKEFLEARGFGADLSEGDEIIASLKQIRKIQLLKKTQAGRESKPLSELNQSELEAALSRMEKMGFRGLCDDLIFLPRMYFENEVSSCYVSEDQIQGLLLIHRLPSSRLKIVLLSALGKDYNRILVKLMKRTMDSLSELYPEDTEIIIDRHNLATLALGEKLFPNELGKPFFIGSRKEKA